MTNALYTAQAHVTGGRINGHGRSADGALEVDLRVPAELGGQGGGTNPEELFAVGFAACFEARSQPWDVDESRRRAMLRSTPR